MRFFFALEHQHLIFNLAFASGYPLYLASCVGRCRYYPGYARLLLCYIAVCLFHTFVAVCQHINPCQLQLCI